MIGNALLLRHLPGNAHTWDVPTPRKSTRRPRHAGRRPKAAAAKHDALQLDYIELRRSFGARLQRALDEAGESHTSFAKKCGTTTTAVNRWVKGVVQPGLDNLFRISAALGDVSVDWMLFGDGGSEVRRRAQSRTQAALEADVAAFVARRLDAALADGTLARPSPPLGRSSRSRSWSVDGHAVLQATVKREIDNARELLADLSTLRDMDQALLDVDQAVMAVASGHHVDIRDAERMVNTALPVLHRLRDAHSRRLSATLPTVYPPPGV